MKTVPLNILIKILDDASMGLDTVLINKVEIIDDVVCVTHKLSDDADMGIGKYSLDGKFISFSGV